MSLVYVRLIIGLIGMVLTQYSDLVREQPRHNC